MMFHQSHSRYQRTKDSKIKRILLASLLLTIAIWLLYQLNHSNGKGAESVGTEETKLTQGDSEINFGRKVKAGSENVIVIDTHNENSDEASETNESGGTVFDAHDDEKAEEGAFDREHEGSQEDTHNENSDETSETNESGGTQAGTSDGHTEEKAEVGTFDHGQEDSQEDTRGSDREERLHEPNGNEDDRSGSYTSDGGKADNEGISEGTEEVLHLPSQRDSEDDQNEKRNEDGGSLEENELPQDDGIVESKSDDGEAIRSDEETIMSSNNHTELSDNAESGAEGSSSSSLTDDQNNSEVSVNDMDDKQVAVDLEGVTGSDSEISVNSTGEEPTTDAMSDDQLVNSSSEQSDVSSSNSEAQSGNAEIESMERQTMEAISANTKYDVVNLPNEREQFQSQVESITEAETTGTNSSEETTTEIRSHDEPAKSSLTYEKNNEELPTNNGVSSSEAVESQGGDESGANAATNNTVEEEKDTKSSDELVKEEHTELPPNEDAKEDTVGPNGDGVSDLEHSGTSSFEAASETSDEAKNSAQDNEQNGLEVSANENETSKDDAVGYQGDSASVDQVTDNNELSDTAKPAETGQEGTTDSESSSSEEELTDPKASQ